MSVLKGFSCNHDPAPVTIVSQQVDLIEAIAAWYECLQGRLPLITALKHLADGLGAKAVCLSRHPKEHDRMVQAVTYNVPGALRPGTEVTRSYARSVLGSYIDRPRLASVWFSGSAGRHLDPALQVFQDHAQIAETVVVALSLENKWVDYLELYFARSPSDVAEALLETLADTLCRAWMRRKGGIFSDAVSGNQRQAHSVLREPVLSFGNPARLSRAQFRVCLLLSRGLNIASICSELSISSATLRTHLRCIFDKTGVTSLAELVYLLLTPPEQGAHPPSVAELRRA